jgi:predicted RNase H-like nuclease (RuvC/YqgF family)
MVSLNEEDIAFLQALVDCSGKATVSDIRERTEERDDIQELEGSHINYRCKHKFSIDDSEETGWVEAKDGGVTDNGKDKPKEIHLVNSDSVRSVLENNQDLFKDYDTMDEKVYKNEGGIRELKNEIGELKNEVERKDDEIDQLRNKMNKALGTTMKVMGASKDDMEKVREVLKEN